MRSRFRSTYPGGRVLTGGVMQVKSIRLALYLLLTTTAAPVAHALTFGELADKMSGQGAGSQNPGSQDPQEPDYSNAASVSRYSCPAPGPGNTQAPQYDARPGAYPRDYSMPAPRYDPYFDPYVPRPYYGYYNFNEPGWSRRQAELWWLRRR